MRILLDARTVGREFSGVGNYVLELVRAFGLLDEDVEFLLCSCRPTRLEDLRLDSRFQLIGCPVTHENHPLGDLWEQLVLPRRAFKAGADILHGPAFLIPTVRTRVTKVVTIHDLVAFTHPETIPWKYALYMRWVIRRAARHATRVITDSHSVLSELQRVLGADPDRIDTIPLGVAESFRRPPESEVREVLRRHGINRDYLLFVGNLEPRKNLLGLLEAYRRIRVDHDGVVDLVVAGKVAWKSADLLQALAAPDLVDSIRMTGYLEPEDLPSLYAGATAFVFPTKWEGFGLPILEAMACGTPVITSNVSSLPEVGGDAAVYVDPHSVESIADGILSVLRDPEFRKDLVLRGRAQAAGFPWARTARMTLDCYRQALSDDRSKTPG